jgi:hypothetical protein
VFLSSAQVVNGCEIPISKSVTAIHTSTLVMTASTLAGSGATSAADMADRSAMSACHIGQPLPLVGSPATSACQVSQPLPSAGSPATPAPVPSQTATSAPMADHTATSAAMHIDRSGSDSLYIDVPPLYNDVLLLRSPRGSAQSSCDELVGESSLGGGGEGSHGRTGNVQGGNVEGDCADEGREEKRRCLR